MGNQNLTFFEQLVAAFMAGISGGAIVQGILTIGLVAFWCFLVAHNQAVPPLLESWISIAMGVYFGGKAQSMLNNNSKGS